MRIEAAGVVVITSPEEAETARLIAGVCEGAIRLCREDWGLAPPADCRIYVMTTPLGFFFRSATWPWKALLGLTLVRWLPRSMRMWRYSAAWTQRYGRRVAIGVKPPRLLAKADRSIGARIYAEERDSEVKVRHVTCHELVHACSASLRLPMWLNEGLAMVTVDRYLGRQTISQASLDLLRDTTPKASPPGYRTLARVKGEAIAYQTARGYWIVRYLEEVRPGLLTRAFAQQGEDSGEHAGGRGRAVEQTIIAGTGLSAEVFWQRVDDDVVGYFEHHRKEVERL